MFSSNSRDWEIEIRCIQIQKDELECGLLHLSVASKYLELAEKAVSSNERAERILDIRFYLRFVSMAKEQKAGMGVISGR